MPIEVYCDTCKTTLQAPDMAAGKTARCAGCNNVLQVPAASATPAPKPAVTVERWTLLTPDGQRFGPVTRGELDQWFAAGRITPQMQLLREGAAAWQWANTVYPLQTPSPAPVFIAPAASPAYQPSYVPAGPVIQRGPIAPYVRHTETVNLVGYSCYAIIGVVLLRIICVAIIFSSVMESPRSPFGPSQPTKVLPEASVFVPTVFALLQVLGCTLFFIPYGLAGYAVNARRQWGRILCFVMAGFSILFTLIVGGWTALIGFTAFIPNWRETDSAHSLVLAMFFFDSLVCLTFLTHAVLSFSILTRTKYAREFR